MNRTPWFPGITPPARRGWYERDHRQCNGYLDPADRRIWLDLWEPVKDRRSILYPGVWYVQGKPYWYTNPITGRRVLLDDINDATHQHLPWRGLTEPTA